MELQIWPGTNRAEESKGVYYQLANVEGVENQGCHTQVII